MHLIALLLLVILPLPGSASADMDPAISEDLQELAKYDTSKEKFPVRSTDCDVSCGIGSKTETRCFVSSAKEAGSELLSECQDIVVECRGIWECGVKPYHADIGADLQLDCQTVQLVGHKENTMVYHWTFAAGVITTDDGVFDELVGRERTVKLYHIQERNAGTYRCQMEDFYGKLIKVIYFAVRVTDPSVFDLNVNRILAKQKHGLAIKEIFKGKFEALRYKQQVFIMLGVGIGGSVPLGIIVCILYRCLKKQKREEVDPEGDDPEGGDPEQSSPRANILRRQT